MVTFVCEWKLVHLFEVEGHFCLLSYVMREEYRKKLREELSKKEEFLGLQS